MSKSRAKPIIDVSATDGESHHREPDHREGDPLGNAARTLGAARERASETLDRASETLETTRAWIVDHPAAAIGIAIGTGFIVGRMVRR